MDIVGTLGTHSPITSAKICRHCKKGVKMPSSYKWDYIKGGDKGEHTRHSCCSVRCFLAVGPYKTTNTKDVSPTFFESPPPEPGDLRKVRCKKNSHFFHDELADRE